MACADARLTRRPGVVFVSRGPGATNASIAVHTAQQDAVPLILLIGQVAKADLRREAFQEFDYRRMFGSVAKWVVEITDPNALDEVACNAIHVATTGTPGPVVLVVPEDIQQQPVPQRRCGALPRARNVATDDQIDRVAALLHRAHRPLLIAGGSFETDGGRQSLLELAERYEIPVAVSFRRHDLFPNSHRLYVGDLGLANPKHQIDTFDSSDLILALGTRLGDITTQGYRFPQRPTPSQPVVHVYPDHHPIGMHFVPQMGIVGDPVTFARALVERVHGPDPQRGSWPQQLRAIHDRIAAWPTPGASDGVPFVKVVETLAAIAPRDVVICLDAGSAAAPVYRHFPFVYPQRLMAPLSGAMGYGTPAAVAAQLRLPDRRVVCVVGDGGFLMTGSELITAVQRNLPVLIILANNNSYGSIRIHQEKRYQGGMWERR
jgi:acetolactate synthase-1/2/3 large subunit